MSEQGSATSPATLPAYLAHWAADRSREIAIRHKSLGVWVAWTWGDLHAEVGRVAAVLEARGFRPGDDVVIAAGLSPRSLALTLAAQGLGGTAIWLAAEKAGEAAVNAYADAAAADRGLAPAASLRAPPRDFALRFAGRAEALTHTALIAGARVWLDAGDIRAGHRAFASEGPTTEAAATFIAGWLVGGISLILPENATTADADRREAQPSIVAASAAAYERLRQQVAENLPPPGTLLRRVVDAGLASAAEGRVRSGLGWWLVRRPLREVLGLQRVELALLFGEASPPAEAREWLAELGVPVRVLSLGSSAEAHGRETPLALPATDPSTLLQPALAVAASSSRSWGKLT
jgi:AMP-binding enzyme